MRICVFAGTSLDGFIAHPDGSLGFLQPFESGDNGYFAFMNTIDVLVIGRATYETVLSFSEWPYEGKRVVVLTHRAIEPRRGETTHSGALKPLFTRLASEGVKRIYLDGGVTVRQGLDEDLVDEMTISTVPRTLGAGRPLLGGAESLKAWKLLSTRAVENGVVQSKWERAR
jgi:dihydrofolate reductase